LLISFSHLPPWHPLVGMFLLLLLFILGWLACLSRRLHHYIAPITHRSPIMIIILVLILARSHCPFRLLPLSSLALIAITPSDRHHHHLLRLSSSHPLIALGSRSSPLHRSLQSPSATIHNHDFPFSRIWVFGMIGGIAWSLAPIVVIILLHHHTHLHCPSSSTTINWWNHSIALRSHHHRFLPSSLVALISMAHRLSSLTPIAVDYHPWYSRFSFF
jgi:hypothetical protein